MTWCMGLLGILTTLPSHAERRALVIGNADYQAISYLYALPRSKADAQGVAQALADLGFKVHTGKALLDRSRKELTSDLEGFIKTIKAEDEVVFYFSGHGLSNDVLGNFLVPVDAPPLDLEASDLSLNDLYLSTEKALKVIQERKPKVLVAILDACRSYPTRQRNTKDGSNRITGLKIDNAVSGQLVMYAASHGQAALSYIDEKDSDPHSVFTRVLLREIHRPAESITQVAERVAQQVYILTENVDQKKGGPQRPEFRASLYRPFTFVPIPLKTSSSDAATDTAARDAEIAQLRKQLAEREKAFKADVVTAIPSEIEITGIPSEPYISGVRIEPLPGTRYVVLANGVVGDARTGLEWMRCSLGQTWNGSTCTGKPNSYSWQEALDIARQTNAQGGYAGKHDWRVPTVRELFGLVDCTSGIGETTKNFNDGGPPTADVCRGNSYVRPTIDQRMFPNTPPDGYWTSSHAHQDIAWFVYFYLGSASLNYTQKKAAVRLVRTTPRMGSVAHF